MILYIFRIVILVIGNCCFYIGDHGFVGCSNLGSAIRNLVLILRLGRVPILINMTENNKININLFIENIFGKLVVVNFYAI